MENDEYGSDEFTYLFDGQTLDGWHMAGPGKFVLVEYDKSLQSEGGMGLLWYIKRKYKDFVLRHRSSVLLFSCDYICSMSYNTHSKPVISIS